jgi:hypothetical protein
MTKKFELRQKSYVPPVPMEMENVATIQGAPDETPNSYHVSADGSTITSCPIDGCPYRSH